MITGLLVFAVGVLFIIYMAGKIDDDNLPKP
jgi:hypothetical protein